MDRPGEPQHVVVTVVRSGGFAGLRREWRAEPPVDAVTHWVALIEECPWEEAPVEAAGADRFQWRIHARLDEASERQAELGDGQLAGPWRVLVDEVRAIAPGAFRRRSPRTER